MKAATRIFSWSLVCGFLAGCSTAPGSAPLGGAPAPFSQQSIAAQPEGSQTAGSVHDEAVRAAHERASNPYYQNK